jgi:hypothetical protein
MISYTPRNRGLSVQYASYAYNSVPPRFLQAHIPSQSSRRLLFTRPLLKWLLVCRCIFGRYLTFPQLCREIICFFITFILFYIVPSLSPFCKIFDFLPFQYDYIVFFIFQNKYKYEQNTNYKGRVGSCMLGVRC